MKKAYYYIFAVNYVTSSVLSLSVYDENIEEAIVIFNNFKKQYAEDGYEIFLSDREGNVLKRFSINILK